MEKNSLTEKERSVLHSLCNGDIKYNDAAKILEISEEKIVELLDSYTWIPSPEKMEELNDVAMETFNYIEAEMQIDKILEHRKRGNINILKYITDMMSLHFAKEKISENIS